MTRVVAIGLLLAVMIPFAWAVRAGVAMLPERLVTFGAGVPVGMAIMLFLERQRDKRGD